MVKSNKILIKLGFILGLFLITSCANTKQISSSKNDGSSIENAIKVSSISEEYKYARANCKNCQLVMQSLIFEKNKPYDLLEFKNPDGEKIIYYFDISKFYGKMFR